MASFLFLLPWDWLGSLTAPTLQTHTRLYHSTDTPSASYDLTHMHAHFTYHLQITLFIKTMPAWELFYQMKIKCLHLAGIKERLASSLKRTNTSPLSSIKQKWHESKNTTRQNTHTQFFTETNEVLCQQRPALQKELGLRKMHIW